MVKKVVPLTEMPPSRHGRIHGIHGGAGFVRRLEAIGLRAGKRVTKVSGQFLRGPVTIRVGHTAMALGHGMASRVTVEIEG